MRSGNQSRQGKVNSTVAGECRVDTSAMGDGKLLVPLHGTPHSGAEGGSRKKVSGGKNSCVIY